MQTNQRPLVVYLLVICTHSCNMGTLSNECVSLQFVQHKLVTLPVHARHLYGEPQSTRTWVGLIQCHRFDIGRAAMIAANVQDSFLQKPSRRPRIIFVCFCYTQEVLQFLRNSIQTKDIVGGWLRATLQAIKQYFGGKTALTVNGWTRTGWVLLCYVNRCQAFLTSRFLIFSRSLWS